MSGLWFILIFVFAITQTEAARILAVFPIPSISHHGVFYPIIKELVKRGHNVTVITTDPAYPKGGTPPNLTEIDVHDLSYKRWEEMYKITSLGNNDIITQTREAFTTLIDIFEMQLKVDKVQKLIKEEKFDLLILEACVKPLLVLSHIFKVPVIQISSLGPFIFNVEIIGSSWHPILYPNNVSQRINNMTMWEKIFELWNLYRLERTYDEVEILDNKMINRMFGPNVPSMSELKNNVDMLFLNIHPLWDTNRPVPPSVIYMGGVHQNPVKLLPQDLKTYLDSSKNGVVYMSLGTNVKPSLLPPEKVQIFIKVLSQLHFDVLCKWDKDELPGRTDNIRISKWLPQSDLLKHPKIKVFITQGGLQSTDEAIAAGVPLIGLPMFADQWYNVEKYVQFKIGVKLDIETLTEEDFRDAIISVIKDESYRQNVIKLRSLMSDQPQRPLERAVWWTEHVLRHGGARHLRGPAANMTWAQYLELDLVLTVLAVVSGLITTFIISLFYFWRFISKSEPREQKLKKK